MEIAAKAYLSRKDIKEFTVPDSVDEIGDWAFAFMKNLEVLYVPAKPLTIGKEILKGCDHLQDIFCYEASNHVISGQEEPDDKLLGYESTPESRLFASAVKYLDIYTLFSPEEMGTKDWFFSLDEQLINWLEQDDLTGFTPQWFGGEEDYLEDATNNKAFYENRQRKKKAMFLFQRLDCQRYLSEQSRIQYMKSLQKLASMQSVMNKNVKDHSRSEYKDVETEEADWSSNIVWELVLENVNHPEYCRIYLEAECVGREQISELVENLNDAQMKNMVVTESGQYTELIAILLEFATRQKEVACDNFADFEL